VAAVLFGSTFVPVQEAIRHAGTVPFLAVRFLFGAAVLAPLTLRRGVFGNRWNAATNAASSTTTAPAAQALVSGLRCGIPLLAGYLLQTVGLRFTTASISAFVTYLLVVIVPLIEAAAARRPPALNVASGVALATAGLFLITGARLSLGKGALLTLGCAIAFAVNIIEIDRAVNRRGVDPVVLAVLQLAVVGLGCLIPGFFAGGYRMPLGSYAAALYTGVAASSLAFGLQVWGQGRVGPTRTSLLLMIEPVTAAVIGWFTGSRLGLLAGGGAALILLGIAVAEVRPRTNHPKRLREGGPAVDR